MKRILCIVSALCALTTLQARQRQSFDADWRFILADSVQMSTVEYNDAHWRRLDVPHDWAIEGDFSVSNPSGASGGALPGGVGWYRKHFRIRNVCKYFLEFDGVYMNATVYVNGEKVGNFHCDTGGQSSASFDIQSALRAIWSDYNFDDETAKANATIADGAAEQAYQRAMREYSLEIFTEYLFC